MQDLPIDPQVVRAGPSPRVIRAHAVDGKFAECARLGGPQAESAVQRGLDGLVIGVVEGVPVALGRALRLWAARPGDFRKLAAACMRADYSWARPARDYLNIYRWIRHK